MTVLYGWCLTGQHKACRRTAPTTVPCECDCHSAPEETK